ADVRRDIFRKLAARSFPILLMRSNELSLEEVFLKLTTGDEYGGAEKLESKLDSIEKGEEDK
ncbi:MAG: ABC transporter, partial [Ruminiclostridium sp.]|nr:ABC transporter [Ruminiclostridium sp.]